MKARLSWLFSLLALALLAACGQGGQEAAETRTMTMGVIGPASGGAATWGIALDRGATLFEEDVQQRGGIEIGDTKYVFRHVFYDTKGDVGETATVTNRLVFQDGVKFIIGNAIGATCEAAQAITEPNSVLFTFVCWGRTNLGPQKPHSFRSLIGPDEAAPMFYRWVAQNRPNVRTLALISPNDQSGRDTSAAIKDAIKNLGLNIQVVAEEEYQRGTQEFTSLLTRVLQKNPDMIDLSGSPTADGALILKQLRELGYRGQRAWLSMLDPVPVVRTAGAEAAEGLLGIQGWDLKSEMAPASLRDFAQRFEQRFGEPATLIAAANYASYQIVTQAMALCRCTDSTKVAQTIVQTGSFDTILGKVLIGGERTYGAKHQFLYPNLVYEMRGGVSVPLARVEPQP